MRARVLIVLLAAAALGAGCRGDERETRATEYIESANAIQNRSAPAFKRANEAYRAFAGQKLDGKRAIATLARAERDIRTARTRLAQLEPPPDARAVHTTLLNLYDGNIDFAEQTAVLARYQRGASSALRPLNRIDRRLRTDLRDADEPAQQAEALERFAGRINRSLLRLRSLRVPRVLRPAHGDQVRRLVATRKVARALRGALEERDAKRVARLLVRFRNTRAGRRPRTALAERALAAYDRRYKKLQDDYAELYRRQRKLDDALR